MSEVIIEKTEWRDIAFRDLLKEPVRNGIYKTKEFHGRGAKIVNMGELFKYPKLKNVEMKRVELTANEREKSLLKNGDLIFARRSLTAEGAGKCSFVQEVSEDTTFESSIIRARPNEAIASPVFLYYYFNSAYGKYLLGTILRQVAVAGITGTDLMGLTLNVPLLREQKAIAAVLSSLDDKIDLLHRQNKTLEAMAETLFRQWFVEGAGDWEEGTIDDVVSVKGGTTPSTKEPEYWDGNIHWTSPRDLSNHEAVFMFDTDRKITEKGLTQIGSGLMPVGTVLMSSRAPIGYLAITDIPVAINQGYIAIVCDSLASNYFIYLWCKANMAEIKNSGNGSVFEEISKSSFKALPVIIPPNNVLNGFNGAVKPIFEKIRANQLHTKNLAKLRDNLLPKLMSGEVRISCPN